MPRESPHGSAPCFCCGKNWASNKTITLLQLQYLVVHNNLLLREGGQISGKMYEVVYNEGEMMKALLKVLSSLCLEEVGDAGRVRQLEG